MKCVVVIQLLLILGGAQTATMVNKGQVDLPSFLQTITNLRNKLLNLLGNSDPSVHNNKKLDKENLLLAHDLVSDSLFHEEQEKKAEKNSLFENMEAMPAHLGGKEPSSRSHQDPSKEVCGKSFLDPILPSENRSRWSESRRTPVLRKKFKWPRLKDGLRFSVLNYDFAFPISLECATNHKVLDRSNSRIVGGTVVVPNSLPWQAFIRINKSFRSGSFFYVSGVLACEQGRWRQLTHHSRLPRYHARDLNK